jgi:hypothetical protein
MSNYRLDNKGLILGRGKGFFPSLCVQTSSEAHPVSYAMGTGVVSWGNVLLGYDTDHSPYLVPMSRTSRSYTSSPWCLHGVVGQVNFMFLLYIKHVLYQDRKFNIANTKAYHGHDPKPVSCSFHPQGLSPRDSPALLVYCLPLSLPWNYVCARVSYLSLFGLIFLTLINYKCN